MSGLKIEQIDFHYGKRTALGDVSFAIAEGQFCALLGPNGAGKSTLFSLLTRLFTPPRGRIELDGHDLAIAPLDALASIGVVFQQPTLDLDVSVERNLLYCAALHGLSGKTAKDRVTESLARLDMEDRRRDRIRDLNGGHRRRTEIARALVHRPSILLFDEPTVGLDVASRSAIVDHVHSLCADDGLTVLWATHLADEVRPDDQLIVLHEGCVLADGITRFLVGEATVSGYFEALTDPGPPSPGS